MESTVCDSRATIAQGELEMQVKQVFESGDEVWKIEHLIQDIITGKLKVTTEEGVILQSLDEVKRVMAENHAFLRYLDDVEMKNTFFDELDHIKERWECLKERPYMQIYYKKETGNGLISVFYRVRLESHLIKPYAMLQEINLTKSWVPDMIRSDIIKMVSDWRKIIYVNRKMPFYIENREIIACATSYLVPERKGAMVMIRSLDDQNQLTWGLDSNEIPKPDYTVVRATVKGFMYVEHIDETSCWFHGNMNVNPNFAYMPNWFLNFILKKVVDVIVVKLRKENIFDSPEINEQMRQRKDFYDGLIA